MFKKTIIAATLVVASFVAFQPVEQAEAKVNIHIGVGIPGFYGHGFYPGYYGHGGYHGPRPYRMSCGQVRHKLNRRGYRKIRSIDCSGSRYTFHAKRYGAWYSIRVKSRNGFIYGVRHL